MSHRHEVSFRFPIVTANELETGTCNCGMRVMRQIPYGSTAAGTRSVAIPRDMDAAREEAMAEMTEEITEATAAETLSVAYVIDRPNYRPGIADVTLTPGVTTRLDIPGIIAIKRGVAVNEVIIVAIHPTA